MTHPSSLLDRINYIQAELGSLAAMVRLMQYDAPRLKSVPSTPAFPAAIGAASTAIARVEVAAPETDDEVEEYIAPPRRARTTVPVEVATPTPSAEPVAKRGPGRPRKGTAAPAKPARRKKAPATFSYLPTASYRIIGDNPFRNGNNLALFDHLKGQFADRAFTRVQLGEEIARLQARQVMSSRQPEQAIVIGFLKFAGIEKGRILMVTDTSADAAEPEFETVRREVKTKRRPRGDDAV